MKQRLIILPGWREKIESFESITNLLKNDFEVFVLPLPGFQEKLNHPFSFDDYLNYLEERLSDFENFYLLGHSFGGALAMLYALKFPQKIKTLILYNPAIVRKKGLKQKFISLIVKIIKPFEKIIPQKLVFYLKKVFYRFIVKSYDYFLVDENLKKTFANINKDLSELAKDVKTKTILLWGEKDEATPLKNGQLLRKLIKDSKLITLPGGHNLHKEDPQVFVKVIKNIIFNSLI